MTKIFSKANVSNPTLACCIFRIESDRLTLRPCAHATGVWATKLGEMAGVKVPLIAMHHAYVVTERIEGIQVNNRFAAEPNVPAGWYKCCQHEYHQQGAV